MRRVRDVGRVYNAITVICYTNCFSLGGSLWLKSLDFISISSSILKFLKADEDKKNTQWLIVPVIMS